MRAHKLGRVVGMSAYELAVSEGYEGTLEAWLESLKYDHSDEYKQFTETIEQARKDIETGKNEIKTSVSKIRDLVTNSLTDIENARKKGVDEVNTAGTSAVNEIKSKKNTALTDISSAETTALTSLADALEKAVKSINEKGTRWEQQLKDSGEKAQFDYNQNAAEKTTSFDTHVSETQTALDKHIKEKQDAFDSNATEKQTVFDENADQKTSEFDAHTEQIQTDISQLKEELTTTTSRVTTVEEDKADKSALALTDRKVDALWKLNQGISYEFQTDGAEAYQKTVPSGAKMANIKSIGGKTIVWNQLITISQTSSITNNGVEYVNNLDGSWTLNGIAEGLSNIDVHLKKTINIKKAHKYLLFGCNESSKTETTRIWFQSSKAFPAGNRIYNGIIVEALDDDKLGEYFFYIYDKNEINARWYPQFFDLTKMFGAGNEPSTVEEFEALFPEDYYPYDAGTLVSASVNEIMEQARNLLIPTDNLPQTDSGITYVRNVDGTVTCNGTSTSYSKMKVGNIKLEKGKTYVLGSNDVRIMREVDGIRKTVQSGIGTFTVSDENIDAYVEIALNINTTYKNYIVKPFVTEGTAGYAQYHREVYPIPQSILDLPGYGWSVGNVCNEVDWEKKKYVQRIEQIDLGSLKWRYYAEKNVFYASELREISKSINILCPGYETYISSINNIGNKNIKNNANDQIYIRDDDYNGDVQLFNQAIQGMILYYELADSIITNISDLIPEGFLEAMESEAGGSLTFANSNGDGYRIPVSNTIEYAVKLSEVASDD